MIIQCINTDTNEYEKYLMLGIRFSNYTKETLIRFLDNDGVAKSIKLNASGVDDIHLDNMILKVNTDGSYYIYEPEIYELYIAFLDKNIHLWQEYFEQNKEVVDKVNEAIIKIAKRNRFEITKPHPYGLYEKVRIKIYEDLNQEQIVFDMFNSPQEEQTLLFAYLKEKQIPDYIDDVIRWIDELKKNKKCNINVIEAFKYLSLFKTETVRTFFAEYMKDMYWDNDDIMIVVLDYLYDNQ